MLIRTTKVYGNPAIYPADTKAQHLAAAIGTKTFTKLAIRELLLAGVHIQQAFANGDCLTVESLDDIVYV